MRSLFDHIDRRTFEAACDRLGIQPERFREDFSPRLAVYTAELEAYVTRMQARDDQILAAARIREQVPEGYEDVPMHELAQRGIIDGEHFRDGVATLVRVQAEEDADPNPADDNVSALLSALEAAAGGAG